MLSVSAFATKPNGTILPPPKQLTKHVYAWIGPLPGPSKENQGYRMNMLFVIGKDAIAVIDTGYTEAMAKEMLAQYLTMLLDHMDKMIEEGTDIQDAIKRLDQSQYSKLALYEELAGRNASWTYLQRETAAFE